MTECSHLDQVRVSGREPTVARSALRPGVRGFISGSALSAVTWLLRFFAGAARDQTLSSDGASHHSIIRSRGGLGVVLRG